MKLLALPALLLFCQCVAFTPGFLPSSKVGLIAPSQVPCLTRANTRLSAVDDETSEEDKDDTTSKEGSEPDNSSKQESKEEDWKEKEQGKASQAVKSFAEKVDSFASKGENISFLQSLGAITGRGEYATSTQKDAAAKAVSSLEEVNPTSRPSTSENLYGRWELLYSSTQLFRSSPFFMAARAVCKSDSDRDRFNWFCDMHRAALSVSQIQNVRQIITRSGRLVSEMEVSAGAVPFVGAKTGYSGGYPLAITGALVSSADWTPAKNNTALELYMYMDTVEVKGSNLPVLRGVLDNGNVKLESRSLANTLEQLVSSYETPKPLFATTYLDDTIRINRDQDDNIFVYLKTSDQDNVTDYSSIDADLGIGKLIDGFRDVFFS